jgi:4-amino-4-deoxy-L-arabinose transferase-like glycosyltransferase
MTGLAVRATPPEDAAPTRQRWTAALPAAAATVVVLLLCLGIALRLWYLFHTPLNSDEAIVGLMARNILHGHFVAFYWGQPYGGGEPYVVAALFAVFGQSAYVLTLTSMLLGAAAAVLTWRVVRRLVVTPWLAPLAAGVVWVSSNVSVFNSSIEYGFRGVTLACGLACVLFALRLLDGGPSWVDGLGLGLVAGVGWWSSPEIAYFLVPSALIVLGALALTRERRHRWLAAFGVGVAGAILGALPWLWANVGSHFASLKRASFPGGAATALNTGFGGRLDVFFTRALPIDVDLRHLATGSVLVGGLGGTLLQVAVFGALAGGLLVCLVRRDRATAIAVAILSFPLLFAAQPGTWYWEDGRYIVFLGPLLVVAGAAAIDTVARWLTPRRAAPTRRRGVALGLTGALALGVAVLTVTAFGGDDHVSFNSYRASWSDPNGPVDHAIGVLEARGVHTGFAQYWVAYKVDLLSRGALVITPGPGDVDRSRAIDAQVAAAARPAWLFVPPAQLSVGFAQFSPTAVIVGPRAVTEPNFVAALHRLGISYRTINAGLLDAVVPARRVTIPEALAAGA